jgi:hypothetical protein
VSVIRPGSRKDGRNPGGQYERGTNHCTRVQRHVRRGWIVATRTPPASLRKGVRGMVVSSQGERTDTELVAELILCVDALLRIGDSAPWFEEVEEPPTPRDHP